MAKALQHWVAAELLRTGAFTEDEARLASRAFATDRRLHDTAAGVAVARATASLPQGGAWWEPERKKHLISGNPMKAYRRLSEDLSETPDVLVEEWPQPDEPLSIRIPDGLSPGDTFLVGDTEGRRSTATVVESEGKLAATFPPPQEDPTLAQWHHAALMEAITRLQRGL